MEPTPDCPACKAGTVDRLKADEMVRRYQCRKCGEVFAVSLFDTSRMQLPDHGGAREGAGRPARLRKVQEN